jgi:chaperone modulatory protein CbpM
MTKTELQSVLSGEVLGEGSEITLIQLCRSCAITAETVEALMDHGILEPLGKEGRHWRFPANSVKRTRVAMRLQRDLGVNLAGAALALDLLERIERLDARLRTISFYRAR